MHIGVFLLQPIHIIDRTQSEFQGQLKRLLDLDLHLAEEGEVIIAIGFGHVQALHGAA